MELQAELARRTAGERMFDEALLSALERGKVFLVALENANTLYPREALNVSPDDLSDVELHYRHMLRLQLR